MIKYALKCAQGHSFESWFQSGEAFDGLRKAGHLNCPACGSSDVAKALMAPKLSQALSAPAPQEITSEPAPTAEAESPAPMGDGTSAPGPADVEAAIKQIKAQVEANSDYVGENFAREARAMHLAEAPARSIHGEAKPDEARALLEDGIPILPLPFRPSRKNN
ncbi:MAG: DUF1178 family protein [Mangrovicoccus sp.]|nr:DUF1178 family protein [Mangrovicoccus sp.]